MHIQKMVFIAILNDKESMKKVECVVHGANHFLGHPNWGGYHDGVLPGQFPAMVFPSIIAHCAGHCLYPTNSGIVWCMYILSLTKYKCTEIYVLCTEEFCLLISRTYLIWSPGGHMQQSLCFFCYAEN